MIHGFIKNALQFGLDAAESHPNATKEEIEEMAAWLSRYPNEGTFADWKEDCGKVRPPAI